MRLPRSKLWTVVLGSLCGLLALLALGQRLGFGGSYSLLDDEGDSPVEPPLELSGNRQPLPSQGEYLVIEQRPLFNNDRIPHARPNTAAEDAKARELTNTPQTPLNATLTGVVITKQERLALVRDNSTSVVSRVREGMPLPGELGGWKLATVEPRRAMFDGGLQGQQELKLDVAPAGAPPPPMVPQPGQVPPQPGAVPPPGNPVVAVPQAVPPPGGVQPVDPKAREAEVQRIIEERRAQMRAEAERMGQPQQ